MRHCFLRERLRSVKAKLPTQVVSGVAPAPLACTPQLSPFADVYLLFGSQLAVKHLSHKFEARRHTIAAWAFEGVSNTDAGAMEGFIADAMAAIISRSPKLVLLDPPAASFKQDACPLRTDAKPYGIDALRGKGKDQVRRETSIAIQSIGIAMACIEAGVSFMYVVRAGTTPVELPEHQELLTTAGVTRRQLLNTMRSSLLMLPARVEMLI